MSQKLRSYLRPGIEAVFKVARGQEEELRTEEDVERAFNRFVDELTNAIANSVSRYILDDVQVKVHVSELNPPPPDQHAHVIKAQELEEKI